MTAVQSGRSPVEGYQPAAVGRRSLARLIDFVLPLLAWLPMIAATKVSLSLALVGYLLSLLLLFVLAIVQLVLLLTKGGTIGYRLCGLTHVSVTTGEVSGGKAFGKYVLESLLSTFTVGIGLIVMVVLIRPPWNQTFLDRPLGLLVIDERLGRSGGEPLPEQRVEPAPAHIEQVSAADLAGGPAAASPAPVRSAAREVPVAPAPSVSAGPVIQSAPWSADRGVPEVSSEPRGELSALDRPVVVDRPTAHWSEAGEATSTVISPLATGCRLELDDGSTVALDKPVVLGREPAAPAGVGDVTTHALRDAGHGVSKTHLAVGVTDGAAWVRDLRSTNGVFIRGDDGAMRKIEPLQATPVIPTETVLFGDRSLRVVLA